MVILEMCAITRNGVPSFLHLGSSPDQLPSLDGADDIAEYLLFCFGRAPDQLVDRATDEFSWFVSEHDIESRIGEQNQATVVKKADRFAHGEQYLRV